MATASPHISERFCGPDADLTIASSDGVLFKVHRKNLELHSDIFADAANMTQPEHGDGIVHLLEHSDVLDLLFQYMYRQRQPDLRNVEFDICARLAEAAEKYLVYSAAPATKSRMRDSIVEHPLEVLEYAARHSHTELATEAARLSMGLRLPAVVQVLPPEIFMKWAVFYDKWHSQTRFVLSRLVETIRPQEKSDFKDCINDPDPYQNRLEKLQTLIKESGNCSLFASYKVLLDINF
ncbi:hypothetical protein C8R44DRAFT_691372 [Mycena epipterygia]|nr:hypothetical protein C8R44DRAFT_691372 [Mycena epipterygia]